MYVGESQPSARLSMTHLAMFAPGLETCRPVWSPTPATARTGPQPRSTSICETDGP